EHERRRTVLDAVDAVLQLLVRIFASVAKSEIVVREIHRVIGCDGDVVRAAEPLTIDPARKNGMRPVLLEAHQLAIIIGTPDETTRVVHARTRRTDEEHMAPA